jgi:hypothetical protein
LYRRGNDIGSIGIRHGLNAHWRITAHRDNLTSPFNDGLLANSSFYG